MSRRRTRARTLGLAIGLAGAAALTPAAAARAAVYGTPEIIASGLDGPGIAVDPSGSVFVVGDDDVVKLTPAGTQSVDESTVSPTGLSTDASGDLLLADGYHDEIDELTPGGTLSTVASFSQTPLYVAAGASGTLYVSETFTGDIIKVSPGDVQTTIATGLNGPRGVAVDGSGDVFVAVANTGQIDEISPGGSPTPVASGLQGPDGVAVDSSGDLFTADYGDGTIDEITPGGSPVTIATLTGPQGIALGPADDIYLSLNDAHGDVDEIQPLSQIGTATSKASLSCHKPTAKQKQELAAGENISLACKATVLSAGKTKPKPKGAPSGIVSFAVSPQGENGETLSPDSCRLPAAAGKKDSCTTTFSTSTEDTYALTASYGGDATFAQSSVTKSLTLK